MDTNNIYEGSNTKAFFNLAWISFGISFVGTMIGIYILEVSLPAKGFFLMSYLFSVSSCFTVAKVVRDKQEAERIIRKVEKAKTEKMINDYVSSEAN
ncbi:YiaA/YiaB family inner membrane protein [Sediminitomix flava]|uniref:YiaAB two helix domain-containing protein n=1 Tax=Sediminitomix flava TaxID=379075 RepID=A0A315Z6J2_SEDFL|nr:YiaA/YiaB family inner membrane protein [Sediminitomix flava]PWJ39274.1 hypothetical protein BC781_106175 [Sediminitomix flava]